MIIDSNGTFSASQAITGTAISQNVLDLRNAAAPAVADDGIRGGAAGVWLWLEIIVTQAFNNLTSLTITLESDSAAGLSTAPVIHLSTGAIPLASLTLGARLARWRLPSTDYKRYTGLRYTVAGTNPSQGALFAAIGPGLSSRNTMYPNGFAIVG